MKYKILIVAIVFATSFAMLNTSAKAQLPRDVQDMFEGMLDDLDDDLRA